MQVPPLGALTLGKGSATLEGLRDPVVATWQETWCPTHFGLCEPEKCLNEEQSAAGRAWILHAAAAGCNSRALSSLSGHAFPRTADWSRLGSPRATAESRRRRGPGLPPCSCLTLRVGVSGSCCCECVDSLVLPVSPGLACPSFSPALPLSPSLSPPLSLSPLSLSPSCRNPEQQAAMWCSYPINKAWAQLTSWQQASKPGEGPVCWLGVSREKLTSSLC